MAMKCSAMASSASPGVMKRPAAACAARIAASRSEKTLTGSRQESSPRAHVCASSSASASRASATQVRRPARSIQASSVRSLA